MSENGMITLRINGHQVSAPTGVTVLRAAELSEIFIPTLCSHKDLSPFGGCRMCIVEIEGIRGYPLACYTIAEAGMDVRTDTVAIDEIRREVLQLILSEHPSSCLICEESEECKSYMGTVRKAGVSTGCRYCPNDDQCELQDLVERYEIKTIDYPILYRQLEAERHDPFYDRDYNICILCGRCVRMCQEMRGTGVLAFNWRGPQAIVGTAFGRNHIEAGCEFCGACVMVCPTGALAEKASKWDGKPDGGAESTCPFCSIGCQFDLLTTGGSFSKALPVHDDEVNDGQACLKGRFCMGEVSHHFERARKPMLVQNRYRKEVSWDEAFEAAAERLGEIRPEEFAMLVSPDCTNEALYTAQKFARTVIGSHSCDSPVRDSLGGDLGLWARMFRKEISLTAIKDSEAILAVGLDTRFNFSIVGVEIRKALKRGSLLVAIDARESNLARYARSWLRPTPGAEGVLLEGIAKSIRGKRPNLKRLEEVCGIDAKGFEEAAARLRGAERVTVVLGPSVFGVGSGVELARGLKSLMTVKGINLIPLYPGANTRGAMEMGAFPELLPGMSGREDSTAIDRLQDAWGTTLPRAETPSIEEIRSGAFQPRVLYLVGSIPFFERPSSEFVIVQDIFEPPFEADLYLPAASFFEASGTLTNVEGRVQAVPRLEELPDSVIYGRARPDWWILARLARAMGHSGFAYEDEADLMREIASVVPGFPMPGKIDRKRRVLSRAQRLPKPSSRNSNAAMCQADGDFLLVRRYGGYVHRGVDITSKVEGLQILDPESGFHIHPDDAADLGVAEGDALRVTAEGRTASAPARMSPELPRRAVYLYVSEATGGVAERSGLEPLYRLQPNPCSVEVTKDAV